MRTSPLAVVAFTMFAAACSSPGAEGPAGPSGPAGPVGQRGNDGASVVTTAIPSSDPRCSGSGGVELIVGTSTQTVCNGQPGAPATTVSVAALPPADVNCPAGGVRITAGTMTSYACNGTGGGAVTAGAGLAGDGSPTMPLVVAFGGSGTATLAAHSDHTHGAAELDAGTLGVGVLLPAAQVVGEVGSAAAISGQTLDALDARYRGYSGLAVFATPGAAMFLVPPNVTRVLVSVWGGGGGGGGAAGNGYAGGGGGGGGYGMEIVAVTPGSMIPVTVAAGGTPGSGGNGAPQVPGGPGGDSSFGTMVSATGGGGGNALLNMPGSGSGGTSTAALNITGEEGEESRSSGDGIGGNGRRGGASPRGGAGGRGACRNCPTPGVGQPGVAPGGGGGSAGYSSTTTISPGAGAPGRVVVRY